jgi:uncharacterized protein involved in exopolysaccharide biosynthesis
MLETRQMDPRGSPFDLPGIEPENGSAAPPLSLSNRIAFAMGAFRRRKRRAALTFFFGVAASCLYVLVRPPTYHVETKILAQKQQTLPSAARPIDDAPTRSASDLVHRRENLITLIKQTNLFAEKSPGARSAVSWPERLLARLSSESTDDDRLNTLVTRLDKALIVSTGDGTVTIEIKWPDPQQAYRLVEAALQNFLEARHVQEITAIDEVISLLQARASKLREQLDSVLDDVLRASAPGLAIPRKSRRADSEETVRLKSMLDAKQRAIRDVEEFRRRRLADLHAQLEEKRGIYSDAYPSVVALRQDIEALSHESPQIETLRQEEAKLRAEYSARAGREVSSDAVSEPAPARRASRREDDESPDQVEQVRDARFAYQRMLERINAAQVELDAARAGYKYRYAVIWPAQVPKRPMSSPWKVLGLGTLASMFMALLAAVLAELKAGRVLERWQIERTLQLPVLAELRRK